MSDDTPIARGVFKQPDCENCPCRYETKVPPEGDPRAAVMLIGEAPGHEEIMQGRPFRGRSGLALNALLKRLGVPRGSLWITNTALCMSRKMTRTIPVPCPSCLPKRRGKKIAAVLEPTACATCGGSGHIPGEETLNDKQVLAEAVQHCRARLYAEVEAIQPKVIVPLGRFALEAFIGPSSGIIKHRGAVHRVALNGTSP